MKIASYGLTDVGRKRQHNEDAYFADDELGLYVVCDGMGGHAAGEVASARTIEVIVEQVRAGRGALDALARDPSLENRLVAVSLLEGAVQKACAEVYRLAQEDQARRGMGTTCVALAIAGGKGLIAHVGDSRIYLLRAGQVHRLTEDHTLVHAQVKQGVITPEQAATSQFRNVITRAVGIQESVQVDTLVTDVLGGDRYVLCSDGLHGYLEDDQAAQALAGEVEGLPRRLIDLANDLGGKDNITAVAVQVPGAPAAEAAGEAEARIEAMRRIPLFRHLTYKEQMAVLALANVRTFGAGEEVVREGSPGDELFVVVRGRVVVEKGGVEIAQLRAGGHFGEMGLIDNAPRSATVRASESTRCVVLARADLMALMRREPVLAVKLLWSFVQVLSERLRSVNTELSEARQELLHGQPFGEG